jgi:hypothetical protein
METLTHRLRATGDHLAREGVAFVTVTRDAGRGFVDTTREAAASAVTRTRDAGENILTTARSEADAWRGFLEERRTQLASGVRQWVSLRTIEYRLLRSVHRSIAELDGQLEGRLKELAPEVAETSPTNGAPAPKAKRMPIGNYETLTAKEVVARLDRLSAGQIQKVYEHERKSKQRQTVLKAAKQRLSN